MKKYIITLTSIIFTLALLTGCQNNQSEFDELNAKITSLTAEVENLKNQNDKIMTDMNSNFNFTFKKIEDRYKNLLKAMVSQTDSITFSDLQLLASENTIFKSSEIDSLDWLTPYIEVDSVNSLKSDHFSSTFDSGKDDIVYTKDNLSLGYNGASEYKQLKWVKITGNTSYEIPREIKIGDAFSQVITKFPINTDWKNSSNNVFYQEDIKSNSLSSEYGVFNGITMKLVDQGDTAYMEIDFSNDIVTEIRLIMN